MERNSSKMFVSVSSLLLCLFCLANVSSQNIPTINCATMMPDRVSTIGPQMGPSPFKIKVYGKTYKAGTPLKVTLMSIPNRQFQYFMIQARKYNSSDVNPYGSFSGARRQVMIQECSHSTGDSYVKVNRDTMSDIVFKWTPPRSPVGHIQFIMTIFENDNTFWVREKSGVIADETRSPPLPREPEENVVPMTKQINTADCGKSRGCYRHPPGCWELNCLYIVTWKNLNRSVEFEMSMLTDNMHNRYMTLAFSDDIWEGDDLAIDCIEDATHGVVRLSLSRIDSINVYSTLPNPKLGLSNVHTSYYNSRLRCLFNFDKFTNLEHSEALRSGKWHILLGGGKAWLGEKLPHGLGINQIPIVSVDEVSMSDLDDISGVARYPMAKAHSILMVLAWVFCASIGFLWSKYYKKMWPNSRCCGKRYWFVHHWTLMTLVFLFTILAMILFFIDAGGYYEPPFLPLRAHPPLCIIVTVCVIVCALLILCSPHKESWFRPVFNWTFFIFCLVACVLAMPTLLIGLDYGKMHIPGWVTWIIMILLLLHLIINIVLEIHDFCYHDKNQERQEKYEYEKANNPKDRIPEPHPVGRRFKRCMMFTHIFFTTIFTFVVVVAIMAS